MPPSCSPSPPLARLPSPPLPFSLCFDLPGKTSSPYSVIKHTHTCKLRLAGQRCQKRYRTPKVLGTSLARRGGELTSSWFTLIREEGLGTCLPDQTGSFFHVRAAQGAVLLLAGSLWTQVKNSELRTMLLVNEPFPDPNRELLESTKHTAGGVDIPQFGHT